MERMSQCITARCLRKQLALFFLVGNQVTYRAVINAEERVTFWVKCTVCVYLPYHRHYGLWDSHDVDGEVSIEIEADDNVVDHYANCSIYIPCVKR